MSLHDRIKEARIRKGLTQTELGAAIGVAKTTIAGYEKNREPTAAQLGEIADVLDVDVTFLLQNEIKKRYDLYATPDEMDGIIKKYRLLDQHGKEAVDSILDIEHRRCLGELKRKQEEHKTEESAESGAESILYYFPMYDTPMSAGTGQAAGQGYPENVRLVKEPPRGASYIAPVCGDSMEPTYQNGNLLFIHAASEIEPGQVGVFLMDGQQWVKELGDGVLISHNSEYDPIPFEEGIQCQGLVLSVCDESYFE